MPLGYGSNIKPPQLLSSDVGTFKEEKKSTTDYTFLRIIITVAEVAIAFTGIGAVAETAVGVGAGIANQVLDAATGNVNAIGTAINFATPFLGGGFTGLSNFRQVGKLEAGVEAAIERSFETEKLSNWVHRLWISNVIPTTNKFSRINKGTRGIANRIVKISGQTGKESKELFKAIEGSFARLSKRAIVKGTDNSIRETVEDVRFRNVLEQAGIPPKKINDWIRRLSYSEDLNQFRSTLASLIRNLDGEDALNFAGNLTKNLTKISRNEVKQLPLARILLKEFDKKADKLLMKTKTLEQESKPSILSKYIKKVNSAEFNDKVVQKVQMIDPNDLGRAPIEYLYKKIKNKLGKYFERTDEILSKSKSLEDSFVKTGGKLVKSSWILGYKYIRDIGFGEKIIMIQFRPTATNNKHPVFVVTNDKQIERFVFGYGSPGKYYRRYWAYSKGTPVGLTNIFGSLKGLTRISSQAISVLGFIPVQGLKNIISIVSNWVENGADLAKGKYAPNYTDKFLKSMRNTAISRSFRLAGKVLGGGVAGKLLGARWGNFIGSELQRIGTQILAKGIKNTFAGKSFDKGLTKSLYQGATISLRSNVLRGVRRKRGRTSVIANSLSARRKIQVVKRIPNAVMPGRPFKGFKI